MGFFERLKEGLSKTRESIANGLDSIFGDYSEVDDDFFEDLTDVLIMSDMGVATSQRITEDLKTWTYENHVKDPAAVRKQLKETVAEHMRPSGNAYAFLEEPCVILVIGVNGVGKTTTIGKIACNMAKDGKNVILCAADTFRAAAIEQLQVWADRAGAQLVRQAEESDPASVVYDGVNAMKARKADALICDTAGRLHNKKNLMDELAKMNRIIDRELAGVRKEVLLVLDATTGQNALSQAKEFEAAAGITGLVITKMDGTAKGGVAVAVADQLNVPILYIGVGEQQDDLQKFDPDRFAEALIEA